MEAERQAEQQQPDAPSACGDGRDGPPAPVLGGKVRVHQHGVDAPRTDAAAGSHEEGAADLPSTPAEWFVVDLFEHADQAAASPTDLAMALGRALAHGRFDRDRLLELARRYSSRATQSLIAGALAASAP